MNNFFTNIEDVEKHIDNFLEQRIYRPPFLYIIMRYGYTENECRDAGYSIELMEYSHYDDDYSWNNDWFEGETFIEVYAILTDDDILSAFIKDGE